MNDVRSRRGAVLALAVVTVLAMACSDAAIVAVDADIDGPAGVLASKQAPRPVPFAAATAWTAIPTFAPGFPDDPFALYDFDGRCSVPSTWVLDYPITGDASHLGAVTGFGSHCAVVVFNPDGTLGGSGSDWGMTLVADNGDELSFTGAGNYSAGTTDFGAPWWSQDWSITGGTGRFVGATGHGSLFGVFVGFGEPSPVTLEGTITYDASNRSRR